MIGAKSRVPFGCSAAARASASSRVTVRPFQYSQSSSESPNLASSTSTRFNHSAFRISSKH